MISVLIADDNVSFCETLFSTLTKEKDLKVSGIVHDGKKVEEKYFEIQPDIMLLDLNIPEKDGLEIIKDLTSKEIKPKQNIIVISGDIKYRAKLTNVEKVKWIFSKPFETKSLIEVIRNTAEQKNIIEKINDSVDELLSELRIPFSKGRKLLKKAILIAYTKPFLLLKVEMLMNDIAEKEHCNARSVRSTIDKTIKRTFYYSKDNSVFYILTEYYGEVMTTKEFISSCVMHIRKSLRSY